MQCQESKVSMTQAEFDAETARLEGLIAVEDAGKKCSSKPLAEKIAHNQERNRLAEQLRQHKLNYFGLIDDRSTRTMLNKHDESSDRLFIGVYSCGICYADRKREKNGDYARLAFLPYDSLQLAIEPDCPVELRSLIEADAAQIQARSGELFQVSSSGQTVVLGSKAVPQDDAKPQRLTLQDACRLLGKTGTLQQVEALDAQVNAGFVADTPTVRFSDNDWSCWTNAVRSKAQCINASMSKQRRGCGVPEQSPEALFDPRFREQVQALKDVTALLNGQATSPVVFSTDAKPVDPVREDIANGH